MTYEEKRLGIAKFLGWHSIEDSGPLNFPWSGYPPENPIIGRKQQIPDYPGKFELMHEALNSLDEKQLDKFITALFDYAQEKVGKVPWDRYVILATPEELSDIFVKVFIS